MRTNFTPTQLADHDLAAAEKQLRACVHCGICTATCPTYVLLGDELDGPRGRIQLIQQMLETGAAPRALGDGPLSASDVSSRPSNGAGPGGFDAASASLPIRETARKALARRRRVHDVRRPGA